MDDQHFLPFYKSEASKSKEAAIFHRGSAASVWLERGAPETPCLILSRAQLSLNVAWTYISMLSNDSSSMEKKYSEDNLDFWLEQYLQ